MYVTRSLSAYRRDPSLLSWPPPGRPNSGILVVLDEESEPRCCFGLCRSSQITSMPFPQNKNLAPYFSSGQSVHQFPTVFIPVLDQPLSSNRYYAIRRDGKHKGEAFTSTNEEGRVRCLCFSYAPDVTAQNFDPHNPYLQFEISPKRGGFVARSLANDGVPPSFLRAKGWPVHYWRSRRFELQDDAPGIYSELRAQGPSFPFQSAQNPPTSVLVGKWYCPFMFVKEGRLKDQIKRSMYYKMTLEQRWEKIYARENDHKGNNAVALDVVMDREAVKLGERKVASDARNVSDGIMWFSQVPTNPRNQDNDARVGLSMAIVNRMRLEEERFGWVNDGEREIRIKRVDHFEGVGTWRNYECYMLVESFVLRRMNGSLVLTYDFKHTDKIRSKFE